MVSLMEKSELLDCPLPGSGPGSDGSALWGVRISGKECWFVREAEGWTSGPFPSREYALGVLASDDVVPRAASFITLPSEFPFGLFVHHEESLDGDEDWSVWSLPCGGSTTAATHAGQKRVFFLKAKGKFRPCLLESRAEAIAPLAASKRNHNRVIART